MRPAGIERAVRLDRVDVWGDDEEAATRAAVAIFDEIDADHLRAPASAECIHVHADRAG